MSPATQHNATQTPFGHNVPQGVINWTFAPENAVTIGAWGFWFGIAGLILTAIGFVITFTQISRTKSAAQAASSASDRIKDSLTKYDAVQEATKASYAISIARKYLRAKLWMDAAEAYEDFRRSIVTIKSNVIDLPSEQVVLIENASSYIEKLCEKIEPGAQSGTNTIDIVKTSARMKQHDQLILDIK